jgi:hypothetical protein
MDRNFLFVVSASAVTLGLLVVFLSGVIIDQDALIKGLRMRVDAYAVQAGDIDSRYIAGCGDSYMSTPSGRRYVKLSVTADEDGVVRLLAQNIGNDPLLLMNIREMGVVYNGRELVADYISPTFKKAGSDESCRGTLFPTQTMECTSSDYASEIETAADEGKNAFVIGYLKADTDAKPYILIAEEVCVRLA